MGVADGPEKAKTAVLNTLQTYVPAQLAAIKTNYGSDGLTPPNPKTYLKNYRERIGQYPAIMVSSYPGGQVRADGAGAVGWYEMEHHIEAVCVLQSDKLEVLETQAERMLLAMQEAIGLHPRLDGTTAGAATLGRYGRALHAPQKGIKSVLTMSVAWEITVVTQEAL